MNILDQIVLRKKEEVALAKQQVSVKALEAHVNFNRQPFVFKDFLLDEKRTGIISEFKRRSPSKGLINGTADVAEVTQAYNLAGAAALSILTDTDFFGGKAEDLFQARAVNNIPILRKDFMIDEYQIPRSQNMGSRCDIIDCLYLKPTTGCRFW
ncbi:indole-3-glycerol-phosphate synthase [Pedobacter sp. UC225_65]|uniref:indole-3-glycerol phosphate synthase TrpC n=1 Tax=Pedobacter sp. UC225_65 TaxID=3350173 RepID=UPI003672D177